MLTNQDILEFATAAINRGEITEAHIALGLIHPRGSDNPLAQIWTLLWLEACFTCDQAKADCYRQLSLIYINGSSLSCIGKLN